MKEKIKKRLIEGGGADCTGGGQEGGTSVKARLEAG